MTTPIAEMTGRQRLLAAYARQPVDRVPCSPRVWAWMLEQYGDVEPATLLRMADEFGFDPHFAVGVHSHVTALSPSIDFDLPHVEASVEESREGDLRIVRRVFRTPSGMLTDVTRVPPPGDRTYGISPNPVRTEYMVKGPEDLDALRHLLPEEDETQMDAYIAAEKIIGDRGLVELRLKSQMSHRAGGAMA